MLIHLHYDGDLVTGSVIHAAYAVKNLILVKLEKISPEIEKNVLLIYNGKQWQDGFGLHNKVPALFDEILQKLEKVVKTVQQ